MVGGGSQSGRTTIAQTLIASLAQRFAATDAHLYVVEREPSGLSEYAALPHCGGVFSPGEPDRLRRFIAWLDAEVQRRNALRFGRAATTDPAIVVIVDGWEAFENRSDPSFVETSLLQELRSVIGAGPPVRVHVVAIGGEDMLAGKLPSLYSQRVLLPFPKEDVRRQHLASGTTPPPVLKGRAVEAASSLHLQVCLPGTTTARLVAGSRPSDGARSPRSFPSLPTDEVPPADLDPPSLRWTPLGVGGPDLTAVGVDLFDGDPHLLLVSGPSGSGRTQAAAAMAAQLRRVGVGVLAIAPPRSPLPSLLPSDAGVRVVVGSAVKDSELRDAVEHLGDGPYAVVVDDCEQLTVVPTVKDYEEQPTLLEQVAAPASRGQRALILTGDALPILSGQRRSLARVLNEVMTDGVRVFLTPASVPTAREVGLVLERDQVFAWPPGRGYLMVGRSTQLVQLFRAAP
jgi:S-DNA-T family DNA segregation ATPase FtsK/SpoIIIE